MKNIETIYYVERSLKGGINCLYKMTGYWVKTQFYYQDYDVLFGTSLSSPGYPINNTFRTLREAIDFSKSQIESSFVVLQENINRQLELERHNASDYIEKLDELLPNNTHAANNI